MRPLVLVAIAAAALTLTLCGCRRPVAAAMDYIQGSSHGRYASVGIYSPSRQWTRLIAAQQSKDAQLARPIDDQAIIVVQDTQTGEVRGCGDLTGYCIGMNPWKTTLTTAQIAPVRVTEHEQPPPPVEPVAPTAK